jgi:hypothetical protein
LIEQLAQAFDNANRLDKNISPVRASDSKRAANDPKGRGTIAIQKTAVIHKGTAVIESPRRVEKLVIGGAGGDHRFKR